MRKIAFAKYQALGNSFIVLDKIHKQCRSREFEKIARTLCDATYGIGADGIMVLSKSSQLYRADIYNADGSWAEKSGNGLRIAAVHLKSRGLVKKNKIELLTGSGPSLVQFHGGSKYRLNTSGTLGKPLFDTKKVPVVTEQSFFINQTLATSAGKLKGSAVSIGNPHLILFCDHFDFDWQTLGEELETNGLFPKRINVGFVVIKNRKRLLVRDYERGVGPTESSGTGAAAAVVVAVIRGFCDREVTVESLAGNLDVNWHTEDDEIIIKGPVEFICRGEYLVV